MRVVDYCAGAGGKTLAMAATMGNRGHIVACDTSVPRLEGAVKRLRRAGVHNAERHLLTPGDKWTKRRAKQFDRVLVDAPCTGTGTWRRNPDARLRTEPRDLAELSAMQYEILARASELVRPGGRLIYATCSLLRAENEAQMERFLAERTDFTPVPLETLWSSLRPDVPAPGEGPWMALSPARHGTDGFFAAVVERQA
jgi:16S rRNA (cytosine967-C5)-methyltransferase